MINTAMNEQTMLPHEMDTHLLGIHLKTEEMEGNKGKNSLQSSPQDKDSSHTWSLHCVTEHATMTSEWICSVLNPFATGGTEYALTVPVGPATALVAREARMDQLCAGQIHLDLAALSTH